MPWKYKNNKTGQIVVSSCINSAYWNNDWDCIDGETAGNLSTSVSLSALISKEIKDLINKLVKLAKQTHYWNHEDNWYSCPLSPEGCSDDEQPKDVCNCGAEDHNKQVEELERQIKEIIS